MTFDIIRKSIKERTIKDYKWMLKMKFFQIPFVVCLWKIQLNNKIIQTKDSSSEAPRYVFN